MASRSPLFGSLSPISVSAGPKSVPVPAATWHAAHVRANTARPAVASPPRAASVMSGGSVLPSSVVAGGGASPYFAAESLSSGHAEKSAAARGRLQRLRAAVFVRASATSRMPAVVAGAHRLHGGAAQVERTRRVECERGDDGIDGGSVVAPEHDRAHGASRVRRFRGRSARSAARRPTRARVAPLRRRRSRSACRARARSARRAPCVRRTARRARRTASCRGSTAACAAARPARPRSPPRPSRRADRGSPA